jgi:hypothetical protein
MKQRCALDAWNRDVDSSGRSCVPQYAILYACFRVCVLYSGRRAGARFVYFHGNNNDRTGPGGADTAGPRPAAVPRIPSTPGRRGSSSRASRSMPTRSGSRTTSRRTGR